MKIQLVLRAAERSEIVGMRIAIILLLLSLAGCSDPYKKFGEYAWWVKPFIRKITVFVYSRETNTKYTAGQFIPNFNNAPLVWETSKNLANSYADQHQLKDWEYQVCGETFWSGCVRGV